MKCNQGRSRDALDAEIFWFSDVAHQSSFGSVNWSLLIWTWLNFCHLLRHTISDRRSIKITFVPSPTLRHIEIFSSPKYYSRDVWCEMDWKGWTGRHQMAVIYFIQSVQHPPETWSIILSQCLQSPMNVLTSNQHSSLEMTFVAALLGD